MVCLEGHDYLSRHNLSGSGVLVAGKNNYNERDDRTGEHMMVLRSGFDGPDIFFYMYRPDGNFAFRNFRTNSTLFLRERNGLYELQAGENYRALEIDFDAAAPKDFMAQACLDLDESKVRRLGELPENISTKKNMDTQREFKRSF